MSDTGCGLKNCSCSSDECGGAVVPSSPRHAFADEVMFGKPASGGTVKGVLRLGAATVAIDFEQVLDKVRCCVALRTLVYGSSDLEQVRRNLYEQYTAPTLREAFAHAAVWIEARLAEGGVS